MLERKEGEEETYSLIFSSLKHPIRRKILRMLTSRRMTFSEILSILSIDSGHLSYHIENLGELITRSLDGKYELSSVGAAAVKLMSGVEEQPRSLARRSTKEILTDDFRKIYTLFLAIALVIASLYFVNLTTVEQPSSIVAGRGVPKTIVPSQPYRYNITMVYKETYKAPRFFLLNLTAFDTPFDPRSAPVGLRYNFTLNFTMLHKELEITRSEENGIYMARYSPIDTITLWTQCHFFFGLETNDTYDLAIRIYSPDGNVLKEEKELGDVGQIEGIGLSEITQEGTYRVEFWNNNSTQISAFIMVRIVWTRFQKPYFYLGLIALLATFSYPTLLLINKLTELRREKRRINHTTL